MRNARLLPCRHHPAHVDRRGGSQATMATRHPFHRYSTGDRGWLSQIEKHCFAEAVVH